ncbi:MAG TPA: UDP-3-O-acyl-N-acetylglucosamine deacetylase [Caulobacteraceae bacterium]|jgi:UDP-3-O-[3-hydroxymyristoyl] N-acetylglucosamine deacetylase|nr:UDP-3-O-acyl-N-acetylglucosamine deacetylase [Caulobacteraceae bacterium]
MTPELQHTLATAVQFQGVGIHTGLQICGRIEPARPDTGICFIRTDVADCDPEVPARAERVTETRLGTVISNADGVSVSTVEHLMASLSGLAIDNAVVFIDGPEVPIMDGSCAPFVDLLDRAGRRLQARPRRYVEILEPVVVEDGDKRVALVPADGFEVAFEILFEEPAIGRQSLDLAVDEATFRDELAEARTFGFLREVEALRAAGLARGGSMDNVVVIDGGAVLNAGGLRRCDEFVRHKMLDAIGDMALLGGPILGRYEGRYAGHAMNNALARALLARPNAWREAPGARRLAAVG